MQFKAKRRGIKVAKGMLHGFSWQKGGVVAFRYTKKKGAYFEAKGVPKLRKAFKVYTRHSNRWYSQRVYYTPKRRGRPSKPGSYSIIQNL